MKKSIGCAPRDRPIRSSAFECFDTRIPCVSRPACRITRNWKKAKRMESSILDGRGRNQPRVNGSTIEREEIEKKRSKGCAVVARIGVTVSVGTLAGSLMDEPSRNAFIIQQESRAIMQGAKQLAKKSEFSRNAISANFHGNKLKRRNTPRGKLNRYQPKTWKDSRILLYFQSKKLPTQTRSSSIKKKKKENA